MATQLKHKQSPYEFSYGRNPEYHTKKVDRWGNYKSIIQEDRPYTNQKTEIQNLDAAAWLLDSINTPQKATMKISYESDDYAYVQDKKSSVMYDIIGVSSEANGPIDPIGSLRNSSNINRYLVVRILRSIGEPMITEARQLFPLFDGVQDLYFNALVRVVEASSGLPSRNERITGFIPTDFEASEANRSFGIRERGHHRACGFWIKLP
ncbi:MAG: hypothetical protein IPH96_02235 [Saprospiraceae bacterium]|nr:hypothetical protein [Saprospiraceae bacterium]